MWDMWWFTYLALPGLIFAARICDVTIGTLRIILVGRGHKYLAPLLGFFEILVWIVIIGKVMENLGNVVCYIAYAGGFATGNLVGIVIEEKLAMGMLVVRVITRKEANELVAGLRERGYGVTRVPAKGSQGPVELIYTVIRRSDMEDVIGMVKKFNPQAFYSVEDVRAVSKGVFPSHGSLYERGIFGFPRFFRKGK